MKNQTTKQTKPTTTMQNPRMTQPFAATIAATLFICATGCSSFTKHARVRSLKDANAIMMDFDGTRRAGVLIASNSAYHVLFEPAPDAAISTAFESATKVQAKEQFSAEQAVKVTQSLTQLGEVSATVKTLREALFRIESMAANGYINGTQAVMLYTNALQAVVALANQPAEKARKAADDAKKAVDDAKSAQAAAEKAKAEAETQKAQTKAKELDVMKSRLNEIQTLPPEEKARLLRDLNAPRE